MKKTILHHSFKLFSGFLFLLVAYFPTQIQAQCGAGEVSEVFMASATNIQSWTVPIGVTSVNIIARGADGGNTTNNFAGGEGATVMAEFSVTAGNVLEVVVGTVGSLGSIGGGGGGGSGVRNNTTGNTLLIVAGGGGGAGTSCTVSNLFELSQTL